MAIHAKLAWMLIYWRNGVNKKVAYTKTLNFTLNIHAEVDYLVYYFAFFKQNWGLTLIVNNNSVTSFKSKGILTPSFRYK